MAKNNKLAERLVELNDRIDEARTEKSELTGRRNSVKETVSKKFNCSTIEEAKTLLADKITARDKKLNILKKGIAELEEEFE